MSLDNVKAVVLAAGKGVRMKSERPKVLHEILGRPVLDFVLRNLRLAGVQDIIVVVGHQAEKVQAAAPGCRFAEQKIQKGTGHALLAAGEALRGYTGDLFVVAGDAPLIGPDTLRRLLEDHRAKKRAATFLSACLDDPTGYGRVVRDKSSGAFLRFAEESDATPEEKNISECNSGTYLFDAAAVTEALREVRPENAKGELYLTDALAVMVAKGRAVDGVRSIKPTEIYGINSRRDLVAATNFIRWKILEYHMDNGVTVIDPSTTFIEEDVTIGQDTVIQPFTVIRRGVVIGKDCSVGPFAQLQPGTVLEDDAHVGNFVEVKKSRLGSHTKAKHLAYLGDAIIGARVNIGAGTITANYDGVNKHPTVIEDGVHIGSNSVLVAPVRIGKGAKTGAGAVVVRGEVPAGAVFVGVPARAIQKNTNGHPKPAKAPRKPVKKR
ncbi:MAG TPA: NTP transferase domain-containing protein [Planctomycetota bacterium]|nr:NTP transferase domain-containing protein [Planctomycetota bacterium]